MNTRLEWQLSPDSRKASTGQRGQIMTLHEPQRPAPFLPRSPEGMAL